MAFSQLVTGQRIRELRTAHNMTQKELAEKIGLTQQAVNLIEHEKRRIDIKLYAKLINVLDPEHKELAYIPYDSMESFSTMTGIAVKATEEDEPMLYAYHKLNEDGQIKVIEYAEDLADNPNYRKNTE